jgi:hypothetical protein
MFFLETDGSLNIVFDRSSTVEGLLAAFKDAIDGQLLLHEAFLLQHPNLPSGYFNGALVIDDFFAVSALPLFVSACLESIFFWANQEDLYISNTEEVPWVPAKLQTRGTCGTGTGLSWREEW